MLQIRFTYRSLVEQRTKWLCFKKFSNIMKSRQSSPQPLSVFIGDLLMFATAEFWIEGVKEFSGLSNGIEMGNMLLKWKRSNYGDFCYCTGVDEHVFFGDRFHTPAPGPIIFGDDGLVIFDANFIDAIFIAVEGKQGAGGMQALGEDRIENSFGK